MRATRAISCIAHDRYARVAPTTVWRVVVQKIHERFFCQTRRLWRIGFLLGHVLVGFVIVHAMFRALRLVGGDHDQRRQRGLVRWWNRRVLHILNVRLEIEGRVAHGAVLYTANHISWLDIPCLRAVVDAAFVSKDDVLRWPLIGAMAEQAGTIFFKRGASNATNEAADRMTWSLARHQPVIVFPEGTTSEGRTVQHFHARLYQAAIRTQVSVQAVAISYPHREGTNRRVPFVGEDTLVGHLWRLLEEDRIEARLVFCAPLMANTRERRALAAHTRMQILEALGLASEAARISHARQDL